jgi:hypothetical protein
MSTHQQHNKKQPFGMAIAYAASMFVIHASITITSGKASPYPGTCMDEKIKLASAKGISFNPSQALQECGEARNKSSAETKPDNNKDETKIVAAPKSREECESRLLETRLTLRAMYAKGHATNALLDEKMQRKMKPLQEEIRNLKKTCTALSPSPANKDENKMLTKEQIENLRLQSMKAIQSAKEASKILSECAQNRGLKSSQAVTAITDKNGNIVGQRLSNQCGGSSGTYDASVDIIYDKN